MRNRIGLSDRATDVFVSLLVFIIPVLLYRKITRLWWMWDDPLHLNLARSHTFLQLGFSPAFWRAYPAHVFAPVQLLSPKFDLTFFGLNARAFYMHQLIAVSIIAALLYLALRSALDRVSAMATALLAIAGPAFAQTVPQLMTRQYFEGLILAILATWAFVRERPTISAVLYFVSTLGKEVFVPLPLLLLALYPKRWRQLAGHAIALGAYSILRITILGMHIESYGYTVRPRQWPVVALTAPIRILRAFAGDAGVVGSVLVSIVVVCVIALFIRSPRYRIAIVAAAVALVLPILPVSIDMQSRFVLVAWVLAAVAAGLLLGRYTLVLLLLAVVVNRIQWAHTMRDSMRMSDEARTYAAMSSADELLLLPLTPPATLLELRELTGSRGRWLYDEQPLCAKRVAATREITYDASQRSMHAIGAANVARDCAAIRIAALSTEFEGEPGRIFWNFGPYDRGEYRVILGDGVQGFIVPRRAGFRLPVQSLTLRVRYDSPAGWATYSPDLTIDVAHSQRMSWHR